MYHRFRPRSFLAGSAFVVASLLATPALADSSVYVTNNTSKPIKIQIKSNLSSKYWSTKSTYIQPFKRAEVFEVNRDKGITDGKTFTFTGEVMPKNPQTGAFYSQHPQNFALRLRLDGKTVGSHMWQSHRSQAGAQGSWHDDRQKYSTSMNIDGTAWNVTYWAYFTGGDDDVEYVVRENYPLPMGYGKQLSQEWNLSHLNVLSYNVYMRPTSLFHNGQMIRAKLIPDQIPGYDVVVFQEAFDDDVRAELLSRMKAKGYKYQSKILGTDKGAEQDGGVIIVSRFPIVAQAQKLFKDTCSGDDCLADKGVLYVAVEKTVGGKKARFHVFGTHLNNGNWTVQKQQLQIMRNFIDSRNIPKSEAVIMAGDMNINRADSAKYSHMLSKLGAAYFSGGALRGHPYTHDGPLNDLGDGSQSYIDYVLYSARHLKTMSSSFAEVRIPRAFMEWKQYEHEKAMWDLSDHYAVYGNMHFVWDPLSDWDPGVEPGGESIEYLCNVDADCPDGLICMQGVKPIPGATIVPPGGSPPSSAPKAGRATPRGAMRPTVRKAPAKAMTKTTTSKTLAKAKPLTLASGVCRIPPPK